MADRRFVRDGPDEPAAATRSAIELNVAQTDAACAVAGHADLVLVVGPAGTGKTTALSPAVAQLRAGDRVVFGVAPSATAAEVLQEESGVVSDTLDKLLIEHRLARPPDHRFDPPVGVLSPGFDSPSGSSSDEEFAARQRRDPSKPPLWLRRADRRGHSVGELVADDYGGLLGEDGGVRGGQLSRLSRHRGVEAAQHVEHRLWTVRRHDAVG